MQEISSENWIRQRIIRDMDDCVLVLDMQGKILYLNEKGREILGGNQNLKGCSYAAAFLDKYTEKENDAFHQFVLDAIYEKDNVHHGEASYKASDGAIRYFNIRSSFLRSEDGLKKIGVVLLFSDITEIELLNRRRRESSVIFATFMTCICLYLFLWSFLRHMGIEPPSWIMNIMVEVIAGIMLVIIWKTTSFSIRDAGFRIKDAKATFVPDILITLAGCVVLILGKIILLRAVPGFFPKGAPFWDWSVGTFADIVYPFTVILQEFLARGVMQESLKRIFTGKYSGAMSIAISALIFGVLHIAYGFPFMIASSLLLGVLGTLYYKQGNIWGLCIIHYVLGEAATFLRYLT